MVRVRHVIAVYANRKPCMASPMTSSHLTLSDLKGQIQCHSDFEALYLNCEGAELGHKLLFNINRKGYMGSLMTSAHMTLSDLERSNSRSLKVPPLPPHTKRHRPLLTELDNRPGPGIAVVHVVAAVVAAPDAWPGSLSGWTAAFLRAAAACS